MTSDFNQLLGPYCFLELLALNLGGAILVPAQNVKQDKKAFLSSTNHIPNLRALREDKDSSQGLGHLSFAGIVQEVSSVVRILWSFYLKLQ